MYNFKLFPSLFNKIIIFFMIISLLSLSFSFNFDKNIKQELNTLYEATSFCEYYNSITNFSYSIINKILESTNIVLEKGFPQKNKDTNNNSNKDKKTLDFVQLNKQQEKSNLKNFVSNDLVCYGLLQLNNKITYFYKILIFELHILQLVIIGLFFCYFARRNIDENIILNNILENRLV